MSPRMVTSGLPSLDLVMGTKSPFQPFIDECTHLSIDSELKELPSYQTVVAPQTSGQKVAEVFEKDANLPGVLIVEKGKLLGVVSRETFYEYAVHVGVFEVERDLRLVEAIVLQRHFPTFFAVIGQPTYFKIEEIIAPIQAELYSSSAFCTLDAVRRACSGSMMRARMGPSTARKST
jgi:hypothetical protein